MLDARVKIFFVFTDDHDVHAGVPRLNEWRVRNARPNIRVETKRLTHGHVKTLEATTLRCRNWRLQKNFGAAKRVPRTWLDAGSVSREINFLSDFDSLDVEFCTCFFQNE